MGEVDGPGFVIKNNPNIKMAGTSYSVRGHEAVPTEFREHGDFKSDYMSWVCYAHADTFHYPYLSTDTCLDET